MWNENVDALIAAMNRDAAYNESHFEIPNCRAMDVSDCPDIISSLFCGNDDPFQCTDGVFDDIEHEMLMAELNEYAS